MVPARAWGESWGSVEPELQDWEHPVLGQAERGRREGCEVLGAVSLRG